MGPPLGCWCPCTLASSGGDHGRGSQCLGSDDVSACAIIAHRDLPSLGISAAFCFLPTKPQYRQKEGHRVTFFAEWGFGNLIVVTLLGVRGIRSTSTKHSVLVFAIDSTLQALMSHHRPVVTFLFNTMLLYSIKMLHAPGLSKS